MLLNRKRLGRGVVGQGSDEGGIRRRGRRDATLFTRGARRSKSWVPSDRRDIIGLSPAISRRFAGSVAIENVIPDDKRRAACENRFDEIVQRGIGDAVAFAQAAGGFSWCR